MNVGYVHTLETPDNAVDRGTLRVSVIDRDTNQPVQNARVEVSYTADPESVLEVLDTDNSGLTEDVGLAAPPLEYSMEPGIEQPYAEYTVTVRAEGYEAFSVSAVNVLSGELSLQNMPMEPRRVSESPKNIVIGPHTLFAEYPPKIAESEIKPVGEPGEIVLSRVVVPEYVIVHDGAPSDSSASDYWVRYRDYIKNVACSEIYATWTDAAIRANVLAIMSFTLNRVYTEWYRNKGYDFTITSSTAFDHKWIHNRNIFENISLIVDELFADYLSRPNVKQPILTQYCDGRRGSCPSWMSQWGSQSLGEQGYTAIEILRNYYGESMYINTAEEISGVPYSWPGYELKNGASGQKVLQLQEQLNRIARNYPAIPIISEDGIYGPATAESVRTFQSIFGLDRKSVV